MKGPLWPILVAAGALACGSGSTGPSGSVAAIVVTPDSATLPGGDSVKLSGKAQSSGGQTVSGVALFWSTSDSAIATVSQTGVVTARANGSARIAASAENHSGFAAITVAPPAVASVTVAPPLDTIYASAPANAVTLVATTRDAGGAVLTGRPVIWAATGGVVNVTNGVVTATNTAAGTATVTATSTDPGLPSGSATIVVIGHAHAVTLGPSTTTLSANSPFFPSKVQLTSKVVDTFGTTVTRPLHWTTSDATVATVNASGIVTAVTTGTGQATITATTPDGAAGTAAIDVLP
jgi:hypothetical protein